MTRSGVDVASYQGVIDFDQLKSHAEFMFCKATEGTGYSDPTFLRNWTEAKRVGMQRGAYHFARPDLGLSAMDEAVYFMSRATPLAPGDMLALDYEVSWGGEVVQWCKRWLDIVKQQTGVTPYIYLNMSLIRQHDWSQVIASKYPLWLAYYDLHPTALPATPWPAISIKQYASNGVVPGISGRVDVNTDFQEDDDMALREEFDALVKRVETQDATIKEMKRTYNPLYHHFHFYGTQQSTPPLIPPVDGAEYSGSSADLSQVFWRFPDGTMHTYVNGVDAGSSPAPAAPPPVTLPPAGPDTTLVYTTERGWVPKWIAERDHLTITG